MFGEGKALIFKEKGSGQTKRVFQNDLRKIHLTALSVPEVVEGETEPTQEVVHQLRPHRVNGKQKRRGVEGGQTFLT